MSFDGSNPVSIGDATRAADYDQVFDNTTALQDGTGARDKVDIVTGATTSSHFHIGEQPDEGAWFVSTVAGQFVIAAGAEYVGGSWIARAEEYASISMGTAGILFVHDTGLTPGDPFSPTVVATINAASLTPGAQIHMDELADPGAPAANRGRLYLRESGAVSELVVLFATGVAQRVAIETP